jgi:hypothetical protein
MVMLGLDNRLWLFTSIEDNGRLKERSIGFRLKGGVLRKLRIALGFSKLPFDDLYCY